MKSKELQLAIIVDIHNTLLDERGKINKTVVDAITGYTRCGYHINFFTADKIDGSDKILNQLQKACTFDFEFCHPDHSDSFSNKSDAEIKEILYNSFIKQNFDVKLLIDNSKDVCKLFHKKLGIDTMRFKAAKND